jgi:hypothetical protein
MSNAMVALNVGLDGTTFEAALAAVVPLFARASILRGPAPTGEDTLLVYGEQAGRYILGDVARACRILGQDCIAVWWPGQRDNGGILWGPRAAKWGDFDPTKFIFPPTWMKHT